MSHLDVIAVGASVVAVCVFSAVAARAVLWAVGGVGAGLTKAMDRVRHRPEEAAARPSGRKHGHRAVTAFTPVEIRRRVAPPV